MIRLVIADDQDLIRGGLQAILQAEPDLEIVGEAEDGLSAARVAIEHHADVVLMDIEMPRSNGILGVRELALARPQARVIMLTTFDLDEYIFAALRAGASGFLLKTTPPTQLASAIRSVHGGELLFAPEVTSRLVETYVRRPPRPIGVPMELASLTDREVEVFRGLARGLSNVEIAQQIFMGEATVKTHVTHILAKLGLRDRVQAVILAYECGFAGA